MKTISILFFILNTLLIQAQDKPKIIVGVVVDQLRYDLIMKFKHNFSPNGFNRLINKGFFAENMHYNYAPTYTGPGHASIYSGTLPAIHGIAANNWIENGKNIYCTQDSTASTIGSENISGKMSPNNLKVTTFSDELKLSNNLQSKVIGIALKDRGAILPVGHLGNQAYWYDYKTGSWVSSSYYMKSLPTWLDVFNQKKHQNQLLQSGWKLLNPSQKYLYLDKDNNNWEVQLDSNKTPTFPYLFHQEEMSSIVRHTPFGNTITTLLALEILKNEALGEGKYTDVLAISYSSTDYVGHAFGPNSLEIEDTYYRLDIEIDKLLTALDTKYGRDNYWFFLTADHGVQNIPAYSQANNVPAGRIDEVKLKEQLNAYLYAKYQKSDMIYAIENQQIYLNKTQIDYISEEEIVQTLNKKTDNSTYGIRGIYSFNKLNEAPLPESLKQTLINGYYPNRSGDLTILLEPNWMIHGDKGTTHGSPYNHDTHIPFLFYGKNIQAHSSAIRYNITDIAPTLSYLLGILQPNGCVGSPINELDYLKNKR